MFWRMRLLIILAKLDQVTAFIDRFHCKSERLQFLDKYAERSGDTWLFYRLTLHDRFICIYTTLNIIRFDREHFLESMRGTVSFKRPNFHFAETLTTKLCFTTKWLLCDQTVWPSGTRMNFILDKMMEFENCHHSNSHRLIVRETELSIA